MTCDTFFLLCLADLFQLSGIMAVRVAGGPFINFTPGKPQDKFGLSKPKLELTGSLSLSFIEPHSTLFFM